MKSSNSGYDRLYPQRSVLKDEVVLAQAWKKAHTFIRRQNWYADTLELDVSAVCLPALLSKWSTSISSGTYSTEPAWLVPSPKNGMWNFSSNTEGGWGPVLKPGEEEPVLRPLAHVGIREQTVATAVMLCVADCIESAQGDTSLPVAQAAKKRVYSYGNRLFCNWNADHSVARFPWGNSNTYSRYFQDYQNFAARPVALAAEAASRGATNILIVSLDITAFFDNIKIALLINKLEDEYQEFLSLMPQMEEGNPLFWKAAESALTFSWRDEDKFLAPLLRGKTLPSGLPQGLVASGFFANAYLLAFDRAMGKAIEKDAAGRSFIVHDYCRYVDDLRLVISLRTDDPVNKVELTREVSAWVQGHLKKHTTLADQPDAHLRLNTDKTQIEELREVGGDSRTTLRMKSLQQQLSGPFDLDTLQHTEAGLNGLLSLAELGLIDETTPPDQSKGLLRLATVAKTKLEVRDDTLTRFSAYRLTRSLRMRRSITDITATDVDGSAKENLIHDFQATARRLVAAWAVNPSLVQVLRYALDLYPSTELLDHIKEALLRKVAPSSSGNEYERRVAYYVLADIFKAGASETGRRATEDPSFKVSDVDAYRADLEMVALEVLELEDVPWYVRQQASIFLAALSHKTSVAAYGEELKLHRVLEAYVKAMPATEEVSIDEELAVSIVGHQLLGDAAHYRSWFERFCKGRDKSIIGRAWTVVAETNPELFSSLISAPGNKSNSPFSQIPQYLSRYWEARSRKTETLETGKWIPLLDIIGRQIPHFSQENSLLKLALQLSSLKLSASLTPELLNPLNIEIRSNDWTRLSDPHSDDFNLRATHRPKTKDRLYDTPSWCKGESAWMYAIGRILRAAATGEPDFTIRHWLLKEDAHWYLGLRSTWHKRRIGMPHTAEALRGTSAAITPWFSDLLLALLRWPGIAENNESSAVGITNRRELIQHLKDRLSLQRRIFGKSSELPIYRYPVTWPLNRSRGFRVAMIQGLMPLQSDFIGGLSALDVPGYREKHRNHTAALLHLARKHLAVRDYVLNSSGKPHFDLVVFPELTIHVDDQDLMRAFSDATGAMLFYGLVGAKDPTTNQYVNAARWLVPQRRSGRRSWVEVDQGKYHLTPGEPVLGINSWRPYQVVIELRSEWEPTAQPYRLSGSICFDATDLALAADLRNESHLYVVAAMNKDVKTFDGMIAALRYHMYQHVLIANVGEWGGSTAQAPYDKEHRRLISHAHGSNQLAVSVFDVKMDDFGPELKAAEAGSKVSIAVTERIGKSPPAGLSRKA